MSRTDVGIGDFAVGQGVGELKTYALGSCVALVVWDQVAKVGGLIHVALPESTINPQKASEKPGYFADTGLPLLFSLLKERGATRRTSWVKLVGGASILDDNKTFDIGRRNTLAVKKYLWKIGLGLTAEDIGGTISRTVALTLETGELTIFNAHHSWVL